MLYDPEFARAVAQARIARLIAEADAARAARTAQTARIPETAGEPRGIAADARAWVADRVRRFTRSRRPTAVPVPRPRAGQDSPQ
jgi:hypothetical protein